MADYLKKFATQADYDAYIQAGYPKPNVSYIEDTDETIFTNYQDAPAGPDRVLLGVKIDDFTGTTFATATGYITEAYIPDGVTVIAQRAFASLTGLVSVRIPDGVTAIGQRAFQSCPKLAYISIPASLTSLDNAQFEQCTLPKTVSYSGDISGWMNIAFGNFWANPFASVEGNHLLIGGTELTEVVIPAGVTVIKDYTFKGLDALTSVTISDSVTSIGNGAFTGCRGLTSVTIPDSVTSIGESAFSACSGLTSMTIPDSVTSIGGSAFYNCSGLTSVTIPDSVTSIGSQAFFGGSALTSLTVRATTPPTLGNNAFNYTSSSLVIYVPAEAVEAYKAAANWSTYASRIQAIAE